MVKFVSGVALFALIGIGLCGFVASKAHAYNCTTTCTGFGNYRTCNTYCF